MVAAPAESFNNRKDVLNLLFGFRGRIDRQWWWLASISIIALQLALGDPAGNYRSPDATDLSFWPSLIDDIVATSLNWFNWALFWPVVALDVKRWHDLGAPGIMAVLTQGYQPAAWLVGGLGLGGLGETVNAADAAVLTLLGTNLFATLYIALAPGQRGANAYGLG
ncbi:MAG: DUF805 domain-containing protein [Hyphomicrobiales bacterium]|nr:DUF805 domain-containing protein [Hyphomicrobiales bacterium]